MAGARTLGRWKIVKGLSESNGQEQGRQGETQVTGETVVASFDREGWTVSECCGRGEARGLTCWALLSSALRTQGQVSPVTSSTWRGATGRTAGVWGERGSLPCSVSSAAADPAAGKRL